MQILAQKHDTCSENVRCYHCILRANSGNKGKSKFAQLPISSIANSDTAVSVLILTIRKNIRQIMVLKSIEVRKTDTFQNNGEV